MNELGHLSGTTLSNAILDNTTDHTITKTKSCNVLYIFTTACLRVLPLSSTRRVDPPHQGGGPKPVNFKKFIIIGISRFWWWMRSGSDVSLRTAVRHIRPEFRRTLLERSGSPRNMFEGGLSSFPPFDERTFGAELTVFSPAASGGLSQGRP